MKKKVQNICLSPEKRGAIAGMTLIEVLISFFILAIGAAGGFALIVHSMKLRDVAMAHYTALNISKNQMEKARSYQFNSLNMLVEDKVIVDATGMADSDGKFRRTTTITSVAASSNLVEIIVTTDIRNRISLQFTNKQEVLRSYFTWY